MFTDNGWVLVDERLHSRPDTELYT